jgi:hypothetical protein
MLALILIAAAILLTIIFIFTSPSLSPVPYFPTNKKDLPLILDTLDLQDDQVIFDLGAGDGLVIFEAAKKTLEKKYNTSFIAVEINPILVMILHIRRLFHANRHHITIVWGDMFKLDYATWIPKDTKEVVYYLYISPWFLDKVLTQIKDVFPTTRIVTYFYAIQSLKDREKSYPGVHKVFEYSLRSKM